MQELTANEVAKVSGGLPNTGTAAALAMGEAMFSFSYGFLRGFISAF